MASTSLSIPVELGLLPKCHKCLGPPSKTRLTRKGQRGVKGLGVPAGSTSALQPRGVRACASEQAPGSSSTAVLAPGAVGAVLFDMDGVLCDSEEPSRAAAVALFAEMGCSVTAEDFIPFMGTGEANFLGGVARVKGVPNFDPAAAKRRFFEIYIDKYAQPDSGIGFPGALELIQQCKAAGFKVAVASSADRIKVDANLAAAGIPISLFDAVVSADKFERLKPAPDIFLAASQELGVPIPQCVVIEDAVAGVQAASAAGMRSIAVTTTLDEASLTSQSSPALIRPDISHITLEDIATANAGSSSGGSGGGGASADKDEDAAIAGSTSGASAGSAFLQWIDTPIALPGGLSTSRRDVLRLASLTTGLGMTAYALDNLKALSYVSPRAILNLIAGSQIPPASAASGLRGLIKYLDQLEATGGGLRVPDFEQGLAWLNSPPLSLSRDLKGKLVLLDFWTYCCINCMHVLPDLAYLEKKYKDQPVVVVGVHSAKFDNEKDLGAIRNAVLRYDVEHPVVNDGEMTMWRALGVSSWPTLALVSPEGQLIAMAAGEGNKKLFDDLIAAALQFYGERGSLQGDPPVPVALERNKDVRLLSTPLKFPGKIATDLANGRLFISDSNNHRIVVTTLSGEFIAQVGGAAGEGLQDGGFDTAAFNRPQGVAYHPGKDVLYVADTENHALRQVDFANDTVTTLAGNGTKGSDYQGGRRGRDQVLNSPWDVTLSPDAAGVYIAMAGQHQIWYHDIAKGTTAVFSGTGYERNQNGRLATDTAYAQPSGLSLSADGSELFCADSESSSIRAVDLRTGGSSLCAGGDPLYAENLFKFGDRDGSVSRVLLQHPLAVLTLDSNRVVIADSYNHKVKLLDLSAGTVSTLAGTGIAGFSDGSGDRAQFSEPAGLALGADGAILVADTNNSVIRTLRLTGPSSAEVATLDLSAVPAPTPASDADSAAPAKPRRLRSRRRPAEAEVVQVPEVAASSGKLLIDIAIPEGYHFTNGVPSKFEVSTEGEVPGLSVSPGAGSLELSDLKARTSITFKNASASEGPAVFNVNCRVYYCQQDDVCLYQAVSFRVPLAPQAQAEGQRAEVPLSFTVVPKAVQRGFAVNSA